MRAALALLALAACQHGSSVPVTPTLPGESPAAGSAATPAPPDPDPADADPKSLLAVPRDADFAPDPDVGSAPPSAPTGAPITLTPLAPKVGERRTRTERELQLYHNHYDGKLSTQRTETTFTLDEEILAVDGMVPTRVRVAVSAAHESVRMDGVDRSELDLLRDEYTVGRSAADPQQLEVKRGGGLKVYSREEEELAGLYTEYLAGPDRLAALLAAKKLRLGESVQLTDDEKKPFAGDEPTAIWLTIVAADARSVTVQTDGLPVHAAGDTVEAVRLRTTYERATGRMLARSATRTLREHAHSSATQATVQFAYR